MVLHNTHRPLHLFLKFVHFSIQIISKPWDRKGRFLPQSRASTFQDISNGGDMIDDGEIVQDDADAAYGVTARKKFLGVEIPYEGAEVKCGCDVGKV
jgi:hypothetical protein